MHKLHTTQAPMAYNFKHTATMVHTQFTAHLEASAVVHTATAQCSYVRE